MEAQIAALGQLKRLFSALELLGFTETPTWVDYRAITKNLISEISSGMFRCPVCSEHKNKPCVLACNHRVCKDCLAGLLSSNTHEPPRCPSCTERIYGDYLVVTSAHRNLVTVINSLVDAMAPEDPEMLQYRIAVVYGDGGEKILNRYQYYLNEDELGEDDREGLQAFRRIQAADRAAASEPLYENPPSGRQRLASGDSEVYGSPRPDTPASPASDESDYSYHPRDVTEDQAEEDRGPGAARRPRGPARRASGPGNQVFSIVGENLGSAMVSPTHDNLSVPSRRSARSGSGTAPADDPVTLPHLHPNLRNSRTPAEQLEFLRNGMRHERAFFYD